MKKKLVFAVLFIVFFIVFLSGCQSPEPIAESVSAPVQTPDILETSELPVQSGPAAPVAVIETVESMPAEEPVETFEIFDPVLTYDGAYNGPLYGTSEQIGSAEMDNYFKLLDRNGINFFIGMFGISGEPSAGTLTSDQGLGEVIDAAQKHPHRVIPFFNPGIGGEEVEQYLGDEWIGWYKKTLDASKNIVGDDFIRGFGEVETQEWTVRHNDPRVLQLIDLAHVNDISFMFHPVASKIDDVEKIVEAYPDTIFLIHMYREDLDKSMTKLIAIMQDNDNLYFSIDAAHILFSGGNDIIYTYDSGDKQSSINKFVSTYDSKEKSLITSAISAYKPLVDALPDKVMWGTEIGPAYAFDKEVFDRAVKISRLVIAGFDKEDQEAVAYKNALRVFGQGVVVDKDITVLNTAAWSDCTEEQMSGCDETCEIPDLDTLTAEQEACYAGCLAEKKCKEVLEMDAG